MLSREVAAIEILLGDSLYVINRVYEKMSDANWWHPKNLQQLEKKALAIDDLNELTSLGDFGSYRVMLKTGDIEKAHIKSHNNIEPRFRIKASMKLLGDFTPSRILDIGCGLGFTTNELKKTFPNAKVVGIDVSQDAISFAKKRFIGCDFLAEAIDPNNADKSYKADLICVFEFYPFTRTDDFESHKNYLEYLLSWLDEGGSLLIYQLWDNEKSLSVNYESLVSEFSDWEFESYFMPITKVGEIIQNRSIAMFLSHILRFSYQVLTRRKTGRNKVVLIEKK